MKCENKKGNYLEFCVYRCLHGINSNKSHSAYLTFRASSAALIRGRRCTRQRNLFFFFNLTVYFLPVAIFFRNHWKRILIVIIRLFWLFITQLRSHSAFLQHRFFVEKKLDLQRSTALGPRHWALLYRNFLFNLLS